MNFSCRFRTTYSALWPRSALLFCLYALFVADARGQATTTTALPELPEPATQRMLTFREEPPLVVNYVRCPWWSSILAAWGGPAYCLDGDIVSAQIRFTASAPTRLNATAGQLRSSNTESYQLLPPSAMEVHIIDTQTRGSPVPPSETYTSGTIELQFFPRDVDSGEYGTSLVIASETGSESYQVNLRVKDNPWFPILTILAGVALSIIMNGYAYAKREVDQLSIRTADLERQVNSDASMPNVFRRAIFDGMENVRFAKQQRDFERAIDVFKRTTDIWLRWRGEPSSWERIDEILKRARTLLSTESLARSGRQLGPSERHVRDLGYQIDDVEAKMIKNDIEISAIFNEAKRIEDIVDSYCDVYMKLGELEQRSAQIPDVDKPRFREIRVLFDEIPLEDNNVLSKLRDLEEKIGALLLSVGEASTFGLPPDGTETSGPSEPREGRSRAPEEVRPTFLRRASRVITNVTQARFRNAAFQALGYIIVVVALVAAGYAQVYSADPTFGDAAVGDYTGVFLWGFGAEASRSTIFRFASGWGLSGVRGAPGP